MYNTIDSLTIIVEFNQVIVTNFGALVLKLPVVDPAPSFTVGTQTFVNPGGIPFKPTRPYHDWKRVKTSKSMNMTFSNSAFSIFIISH